MPLHLLGKKSWNVYNKDNIERVRRDEAEAAAREEAAEQRMQEEDNARRLAILRGEVVPALAEDQAIDQDHKETRSRRENDTTFRKRRRLHGEDDTDRDIRFAREDAAAGEAAKRRSLKPDRDDAPLTDELGHIQLLPAAAAKDTTRSGPDTTAAKRRAREEDGQGMRFRDAAGYGQAADRTAAKPWYVASASSRAPSQDTALSALPEKDVWGNEDPRRKQREHGRLASSDPFAAMQAAQRQLKQSERDRAAWTQERMDETRDQRRNEAARHGESQKRRHKSKGDVDRLDGFSLDQEPERDHKRGHRHRHRHRHDRDRQRSRSPREQTYHRDERRIRQQRESSNTVRTGI